MTRLPPAPAVLFDQLPVTSVPIASLVRLSMRPATEPFWAKSASHRFDDPSLGTRFGVLYAAETLECAFCESVIHENSLYDSGQNAFAVPVSEFNRAQTYFSHAKDTALEVADLTGANLKSLGLNIDLVAGNDYSVSQQWALAVHNSSSTIMGIRYPSRQLPGSFCYALFERSNLTLRSYAAMTAAEKLHLCRNFKAVPVS